MKIYLLNAPPFRRSSETGLTYPPLGILYLAAYARKEIDDIEITVTDGYQAGLKKSIKDIKTHHPDILGVSFTSPNAGGAYAVINEVKNEDLPVISGGPHPTAVPEEVLNRSKTDIVVLGEGELTFTDILREYARLGYVPNNVNGIARKEGSRVIINPPRPLIRDLDAIPFPARDLIDIRAYPGGHLKKRKYDTNLVFSRGCPYNCTFCANSVWKYSKPYFRMRSPRNIVDEMEHLIENYQVKEFIDFSDVFNISIAWAKQLCDEIVNRNLDVSWKVQFRADKVDHELAAKMAKAGCWMVLLGIESGNDNTLKGVKKGITIGQVEKALEIIKGHGIKVHGYFMLFNVWEEDGKLRYEGRRETENTLKFVKKLVKERKIDSFSWSLTTPLPGSELYEIALRHKLIPKDLAEVQDLDSISNFSLTLPNVSEKDWRHIKTRGEILQAICALRSGHTNLSALPSYIRRGMGMIRRIVRCLID